MISEQLKEQLGDWTCLYPFFESSEWTKIKESIKPDFSTTTPFINNWFRAFKECPFSSINTVFLGLSPYYTVDKFRKQLVADGLAFSTKQENDVPPNLFKIYKGIEADLFNGLNLNMQRSNDLTFLANQGVLLLNSALTTVIGNSEKHLAIWQPFIQYVFSVLNKLKPDLIVVGFGKVANDLIKMYSKMDNIYLEHPAASAYANREWEHKNIFSSVNKKLEKKNIKIYWDKYLYSDEPPF